jgi:hypothetical protein
MPQAVRRVVAVPETDALPISRFTLFDMATWGDWLCERFELQWPGKNRAYWQGKVNNLTASNDVLFIKNDGGVLLITASAHPMSDRPRAMEVFAWSRHAVPMRMMTKGEVVRRLKNGEVLPEGWEEQKLERMIVEDNPRALHSMLSLYRFARDWARGRGTIYSIVGILSDVPIEQLEAGLDSGCADWVVVK